MAMQNLKVKFKVVGMGLKLLKKLEACLGIGL
jgi:hypothetical protein